MYSPVRVSIFTMSPSFRNNGTWMVAPVSSVAWFVPPFAPSPCPPGFALLTSSRTGSGPDRREWKERLREALVDAGVVELPAGPVAMEVGWGVSRGRNWLNLWKPTFDAMGPVLGEPDDRRPFNPADDRITSLRLHRALDDSLGWNIDIAACWRMA